MKRFGDMSSQSPAALTLAAFWVYARECVTDQVNTPIPSQILAASKPASSQKKCMTERVSALSCNQSMLSLPAHRPQQLLPRADEDHRHRSEGRQPKVGHLWKVARNQRSTHCGIGAVSAWRRRRAGASASAAGFWRRVGPYGPPARELKRRWRRATAAPRTAPTQNSRSG
jgi:hypothetical protein